ncbi:hypothetical protein AA103196_3033 [Ameyamaea chiangmaiensis NBRC 103196]|uniref:DUF445 domain-containing protein n=1 Tax=Ameyamaea chiangmaiensis TaxID=442969 RepID=A0A850PAR5_9PROT|nr:DUF445 domain-containing protein [Ameyamaea chiangmaiensis]MBS4074518.1 DUF445 domain-containing protein [Ameyamaea chiangmaiensis]NVN41154.1 DUF445 domain-containing protein [Ameyamaea chiangmaiensis]GBQ72341.1 hypothetical protein AA103196_3033 [Ameyamaea chiangmaiensis NBRC 103196]
MKVENEHDRAAQHTLRRYKRVATGLLVGMGAVTVAGYALPAMGWVSPSLAVRTLRAGAKAGVVGGLADWFAVTALFRRPLGLPIPHTAILPAQKDRLGRALGRFVSGQFFTEQDIGRALRGIDVPAVLGDMLARPETAATLSRALARALPTVLDRMEDGRAGVAIGRALPVVMGGADVAPLLARVLRSMVEGDCHQEVLSFLLDQFKEALKAREASLRVMIEERVREQGGRILGWAIGGSVATRVLGAVNQELERVDPRDSDIREGFSRWVRAEIDRIETDPERRAEISGAIGGIFTHDTMRAWGNDLWGRLRAMIEADITEPDGWCASIVTDSLARMAEQITHDPVTRQRVTDGAASMALRALPSAREKLAEFMASVVARWDGRDLADRLELRVGSDLQYVRMNGTLVGFVVGAVLFLLLNGLFGVDAG